MGNDRPGRRKPPATGPVARQRPAAAGRVAVASALPSQAAARGSPLLYHFCRLQMPGIAWAWQPASAILQRAFEVFRRQTGRRSISWNHYLDNLYPLDWFLASACLEGNRTSVGNVVCRQGGTIGLLVDGRAAGPAARLYPRDEEKQDSAVNEFWGHLLIAEHDGSVPVLQRYDGQRPLVPWLIRVFQNWHISLLRRHSGAKTLPEDDLAMPLPSARWRPALARGVLRGGP